MAENKKLNHWIDSDKLRKRFWANANDLGLSKEQVYEALEVESIHGYEGTHLEAEAAIRQFVMFEGRGNVSDQLERETEVEQVEQSVFPDIDGMTGDPDDQPLDGEVGDEGYEQDWGESNTGLDGSMLAELARPFPLEVHSFKPGATYQDKCLALAYADTRAYIDRLNAVVGGNWSDKLEAVAPDGSVMLCRLTISYTERSDVGEKEPNDRNTATSAAAQAFKRACAKFGLGRYLYDLPQEWVEYDDKKKRITPKGQNHLNEMLKAYLAKHGAPQKPKKRIAPTLAARMTTTKGTSLGTLNAEQLEMIVNNADKPDVGPERAEAAQVLIDWLVLNASPTDTYNQRMGVKS